MPLLLLVILGAATGFVATRVMKVQTDVITTILIGVAGALIGWAALRFLLMLSGVAALVVGAFVGAIALIWIWKILFSK
jgi:uncharacterized membrane protein YeaQ/YmgE (transglycosylase-associated protein family)